MAYTAVVGRHAMGGGRIMRKACGAKHSRRPELPTPLATTCRQRQLPVLACHSPPSQTAAPTSTLRAGAELYPPWYAVLCFRQPGRPCLLMSPVSIPPPVPPVRALVAHGCPIALQLCFTGLGAPQCPRDRGCELPGSHPEPPHCVEKRERARIHRAQHQQCANKHQDQAGR